MERQSGAAGKRRNAITWLLNRNAKLSRKKLKGILRQIDDVVWKRELIKGNWQDCAYVSEDVLADLSEKHAPSTINQGQKTLGECTVSADQKGKFAPEFFREKVSAAQKELAENVEANVSRLAQPAQAIEIASVLKSENLAHLNESQVGAKAAQIWRGHYPDREMGMRPHTLPTGREVQVRNWTQDEFEFLRLAAWAIATSLARI